MEEAKYLAKEGANSQAMENLIVSGDVTNGEGFANNVATTKLNKPKLA
jgi:hypothetical protein